MDKEGLIKDLGLTGVTAQSTEEEIEAAIKTKLAAEKQRADDAERTNKEAEAKRITDAVNMAIDSKRIVAEQKELYVGIGKKTGYDSLVAVLGGIKPAPSLVDVTRGGAQAHAGTRSDWNGSNGRRKTRADWRRCPKMIRKSLRHSMRGRSNNNNLSRNKLIF